MWHKNDDVRWKMRLIDADKLIAFIDKGKYCNPNVLTFSENEVCAMIEYQPTAYDVDKVVEDLTIKKEEWERGCEEVRTLENTQGFDLEGLWRNLSGRAYGVAEAIDIVRKGGVDEQD